MHDHSGHATNTPGRLRSIRVALFVSVVLLLAKVLLYAQTGFVVVLAEALHSLTDILQIVLLLLAARFSAAPPDEKHPFGYGRIENLAAVLVSILFVLLVAAGLVREAMLSLGRPHDPGTDTSLALAVLGSSGVLLLWPLALALKDQRAEGGVVRAQAMESLNDVLGVAAAMGGIALVAAGFSQGDAFATILVAGLIVYNAIRLFLSNVPYLIGGSPAHEYYVRVETVAKGVSGVQGVHSMAAEYVGPNRVHLDLHLTVAPKMTIEEADVVSHEVRDRLENELGGVFTTIHFCSSSGERRRFGHDSEGRSTPKAR
ncbi:MAG: cation transporter [Euryarchaeota archaeon]|nr:cation transporter [Euryarchaeota archaeon]